MGLLKAGLGAAGGVMADQWKEFIYCESMPADVLAWAANVPVAAAPTRAARTTSSPTAPSSPSTTARACFVVQNGKIIEVALEPGEFVFDTGSEPSVFSGNLGDSIKETFANIGSRFTFGGDAGKDQRVYFINTKEIIGNKYGTASPVPPSAWSITTLALDVDISVRCNGSYSYRIVNPLLFYKNVCGNVTDSYTRDTLDSQLKSELLTALQPAFAKISEMGIRYSAIPGHTTELARALNEVLFRPTGVTCAASRS